MARRSREKTDEEALKELEDKEETINHGDDEDHDDDVPLVEVIFKGNRRAVFKNEHDLELTSGTYVIVEADKGEDLGRVGMAGDELRSRRQKGGRKTLLRSADERELSRWRQLRPREEQAFTDFCERVERREMQMKPVDVEYQLDGRKVIFYFTAEHRVDFRELVRELASVYRTRIELRQIGVRDEAKRLGGIGPCGRELCCSTFLADFAPITSQMARDQNLSLNPSKLSGMCGRLKCCLRFEHDFYVESKERFPRLGTRFEQNGLEGQISKLDFFTETVTMRCGSGEEITFGLTEYQDSRMQQPERPQRSEGGK
jgi:cell fate regulator YaaT (PSP1 superfamily)